MMSSHFEDFPRGVIENKIILADCGLIDPDDIDHYLARWICGLAVLEMEPHAVIEEIKSAKLRDDRQGFHSVKWERCFQAEGPLNMLSVMLMRVTPVLLWTGLSWNQTLIS